MKNIIIYLFVIIGLISCKKEPDFEYSSSNFELIKLTKGVYACIHKFGGKAICNVGIIDNGKETFIFDSFLSPDVAEELIEIVEKLELSPIKYVINSHAHNDHIRGNQVFSPDIDIISTTITAQEIKVNEPIDIEDEKEYGASSFAFYDSLLNTYQGDSTDREFLNIQMWRPYYEILSKSHQEVITRIPNVFVDDIKIFEGPDRNVQLISKGKGHTKSDLILYLPDDKILFAADLVFNKMHPYLAGGFIDEWRKWLDYFDTLNLNRLVPGHGNVGGIEQVVSMKDYITSIEELAKKMVDQKMTAEDVAGIQMPETFDDWPFEQFFIPNLRFMLQRVSKD